MAAASPMVALLFLLYSATTFSAAAATWCVVRSEVSEQTLQAALDYACSAGADCAPLESTGLCYLPNTVQAHASYAFNSYYQRKGNAPGSCSFGGTATIAATDPSYGSCVYPSSPRTAGGGTVAPGGTPAVTSTTGTTPAIIEPPPPPGTTTDISGGGVGLNPGMGPVVPDSPTSNASLNVSIRTIFSSVIFLLSFSCLSSNFQIM